MCSCLIRLLAMAMLGQLFPFSLSVAQETLLTGVRFIDKISASPSEEAPKAFLEIAPIVSSQRTNLEALLRANGVEGSKTTIEDLKRLNMRALDGDAIRPGWVFYLPKAKYSNLADNKKYTVAFTGTNLARIQLKSDALSLRTAITDLQALPSFKAATDPVAAQTLEILKEIAGSVDVLADLYSSHLTGSELSAISFQREVAEYLARQYPTTPTDVKYRNVFLLHEAKTNVSQIAYNASPVVAGATGRLVNVSYEIDKKPMHGRRLYVIPLGMQHNISHFTRKIITRALAIGAFERLTSPSAKVLAWGNYAVVAGPPQISAGFVNKLMRDQSKIDMTTVVVSTTRKDDIEFTLVARNPNP